MRKKHKQIGIRVWVSVDAGIAPLVKRIQWFYPDVETFASCQGTLGEGGPSPYAAHVMASWNKKILPRLKKEFDVQPQGNGYWGYIRPKTKDRGDVRSLTKTRNTHVEPASEKMPVSY